MQAHIGLREDGRAGRAVETRERAGGGATGMDCGGEGSADGRGLVGRLCEEGQAVFQVEEQVRQSHPQLWKPGRLWSGSGMWDFVVSEVGPFRMEIGARV